MNTVQLNEDEARVIDPAMPTNDVLAEKILETGVKALVITLAEKGLVLFTKDGGRVVEHFFEPGKGSVVDPTGCGNVFGAAFIHSTLLGRSYEHAVEKALEVAARKLSVAGPGGMLSWKTIESNA